MNFTDDIESEWLPSCQNKEINNLEVEPEKRIGFVGMIVTDQKNLMGLRMLDSDV